MGFACSVVGESGGEENKCLKEKGTVADVLKERMGGVAMRDERMMLSAGDSINPQVQRAESRKQGKESEWWWWWWQKVRGALSPVGVVRRSHRTNPGEILGKRKDH